jgi:4-hydroxy-3-methylbut-2-enyl diphosphate reductase
MLGARLGLRSIEQLAGSKELFVGLAWATLTALVPSLAADPTPGLWKGAAVAFVVSFLMVFERTLLLDLRDVETDQIVGRETLAGLLGPPAPGRLFGATAVVLALVIGGAGCAAGWTTSYCYPLLLGVPWAVASYLVLKQGARAGGRGGDVAEALMDGQFYVVAIGAAAWGWLAAGAAP